MPRVPQGDAEAGAAMLREGIDGGLELGASRLEMVVEQRGHFAPIRGRRALDGQVVGGERNRRGRHVLRSSH